MTSVYNGRWKIVATSLITLYTTPMNQNYVIAQVQALQKRHAVPLWKLGEALGSRGSQQAMIDKANRFLNGVQKSVTLTDIENLSAFFDKPKEFFLGTVQASAAPTMPFMGEATASSIHEAATTTAGTREVTSQHQHLGHNCIVLHNVTFGTLIAPGDEVILCRTCEPWAGDICMASKKSAVIAGKYAIQSGQAVLTDVAGESAPVSLASPEVKLAGVVTSLTRVFRRG